MRRYRQTIIGFFVAAIFLLSTTATPVAARSTRFMPAANVPTAAPTCSNTTAGTASISGTVQAGGGPARNVQVELYTMSGERITSTATNTAGVYSLTNLSGGTYKVFFEAQYVTGGFLDEWYDNKGDIASATPVTVNEGGVITNVNATLESGARISGRVTIADTATPLQSVNVQIYDAAGNQAAYTYTDVNGDYITSSGLPNGNYRVFFSSPGGKAYLAEYYADKPDLASAEVVTIVAPATRSGVDAALAPAARIAGRVTDAITGVGLSSMQVTLYGDDGYIDSDYTDANGDYITTAGLASGTYELEFGPTFDDSDYVRQRKSVTVTAPNLLSGVNAALEKGGRITGRITDNLGNSLPNITVFVGDETNGVYQNYVSTNASGIYTAYGLPSASYIVHYRPSEYLEEYYNDKPDRQLADRIAVTAPNTTSGIDAVLVKGGAVSGRVTAVETGNGLDDVSVEIYDLSGDRIETAYTDATGQYESKTVLPAGGYRVKFIPDDNGSACGYAPEFYNDKASFETSDVVTITPPVIATNINAALQQGSSISGRVTAGNGVGITSVYVQVYNSAGERIADGRTNPSGAYITTPALPSGIYRVGFFPRSDNPARYFDQFYANKTALALSDPITLTAPNPVSDIDAVLAQGGAISGRVTAANTGTGLSNVAVSIFNAAGESVAYAYTNSSGAYITTVLPTGNYRVRFEAQSTSGGYAPADYPAMVVVTSPNITPNIDAALALGATIAGRVTAADSGLPLPDIDVVVYDSSGEEIGGATTRPDGTYTTSQGFGIGTYRVGFNVYGNASGYAAVFYNNKTSLATASSITISSATNVSGIDAALVKGGLISGRVTDAATGAGLSRIDIEVYDSSGNQVATGYTGPTGVYITDPAIITGSYRVRFVPSSYTELGGYIATFYNNKTTLATADAVQVSASATQSGIDAALTQGGQLAGQVFAPGAALRAVGTVGQPGSTVTVYDSAGLVVASAETNDLGFYQTNPGLPNGTYRLSFTPPAASGYHPTFYSRKLNLAGADPIVINAPGVKSGIDGVLLPIRAMFMPLSLR